jgi:hypothetical protein
MMQTASIVCGACGSIIDVTDDNYRILSEFKLRAKITPRIPLGARGTIRGEPWQVIGFLRRYIRVENEKYSWSEYLLFNPFLGFRWLTEYQGHWNYVRQCLERPRERTYQGKSFKHFQTAQAMVEYVIGEFYWRVQTEDTCKVSDYVAPPLMLSEETSGNEVTWSVSEYMEAEEIEKAFQLPAASLGRPQGIFANEPSPHTKLARRLLRTAAIFIAAVLLIQLLTVAFAQNKNVYANQFNFDPAAPEKSVVSDMFTLDGRPSNVVIRSDAALNNAWMFLSMALINDDTGVAYDFGREISFYDGSDADGYWSEGSRTESITIPAVPAGRYYLRIEPEGPTTPVSYSLQVRRDAPNWGLFLAALTALAIIPILAWLLDKHFEYRRWAESDHPWISSGE